MGRKGVKSSARSSLGGALHIPQEGQQSFMAVWIKLIKRTKLPDIAVVLTDFVVIAHSFSAQSQKSILTKVNTGQFLAIYVLPNTFKGWPIVISDNYSQGAKIWALYDQIR